MPAGSATRPTSDRVREAVFTSLVSWLGTAGEDPATTMAGIGLLDLYAGSGAIGLEAASRGAERVLLVEQDRRTTDLARRNADELGLAVRTRTARVEHLAAEPPATPYDIIWLDPPYELAAEAVDAVLADLVAHGWLAESALVVLERSKRSADPVWPDIITEQWTKTYGETRIHYGMAG